jgi:hypothetical protein
MYLEIIVLAGIEVALMELRTPHTGEHCRKREVLIGISVDHSYGF